MAKDMIAMKSSLERAEVSTKVQMTELTELSKSLATEKGTRKDQCQSKLL